MDICIGCVNFRDFVLTQCDENCYFKFEKLVRPQMLYAKKFHSIIDLWTEHQSYADDEETIEFYKIIGMCWRDDNQTIVLQSLLPNQKNLCVGDSGVFLGCDEWLSEDASNVLPTLSDERINSYRISAVVYVLLLVSCYSRYDIAVEQCYRAATARKYYVRESSVECMNKSM